MSVQHSLRGITRIALLVVLASFPSVLVAKSRGSVVVSLGKPSESVIRPLGKGLTLQATPDREYGWEISVTDNSTPDAGNLLYRSSQWHGPYPSQFLAWNVSLFGADRWLCVYNHNPAFEIHAVLTDFSIHGTGPDSRFKRATLTIIWRERPCTQHQQSPTGEGKTRNGSDATPNPSLQRTPSGRSPGWRR